MGRSARNKMALSATEDVLLDPFLVEQIMLMMKTECEPGCLTALADELAHFLTRSTAVCLTWHKTVTICKTKCVNRRTKQITTVCVNNLKQACPHYCDRCSTVDQPKKDAHCDHFHDPHGRGGGGSARAVLRHLHQHNACGYSAYHLIETIMLEFFMLIG